MGWITRCRPELVPIRPKTHARPFSC